MNARNTGWKFALVATALAIVTYFALPSQHAQDVAYVVIGLLSAGLVLLGVRVNRPSPRSPWFLLAVYIVLSTVGDGIENIGYGIILNRPVPLPSVADAFYLAGYPFLFAGIVRLCHRHKEEDSRENHADAAIVVVAAMALSWHFFMSSYFHDTSISPLGRFVDMAYPLVDLGVLFIIIRSLLFGSARLAYHRILTIALLASLVADSIYDVMVLYGSYSVGNPVDAGWLLNYALIAVAALHPSVRMARAPEKPDASRPLQRVPVLALAGFVAPGILLIGGITKAAIDVPVIAATSIALFSLVTLRMSWLFQRIRAQADQARALESELRYQASHDPLTGLANRDLLRHRVETALNSGSVAALCFCDLDGFKTVNDSLGHHYGDTLLSVTAKRLLSVVRAGDTVSRLGGDEFAVLVEGRREADVADIADRIVAALRDPVDIAGREISLSVSVGVAVAGPSSTSEQLLSEADAAMYEAKRLGKSRWELYQDGMQAESLARLELMSSFRGSLERGEFFLLYQPLYSLSDGKIEGFEALVRWQHPQRGVLNPAQFIPLAEENGFIIPLGRWVLETACEQAAKWRRPSGRALGVSVNFSGRQLQDPHICDDVRTALALSGLAPGQLQLEVTESVLLVDSEQTKEILSGLKDIGVKLALDDFGTGYSALGYLRHLPLDVLKIDKTFVDILAGVEGEAIVSTILRFARILKLRTVAEGIESDSQRRSLTRLGCDSAQGFYFSEPLAADVVDRLITGVAAASA